MSIDMSNLCLTYVHLLFDKIKYIISDITPGILLDISYIFKLYFILLIYKGLCIFWTYGHTYDYNN